MQHSETVTKISAAIVAMQAELVPVKRDSENPYFKSKYADLCSCMEHIKPILAKHNLALIQTPEQGIPGQVRVDTVVIHSSGEWIACSAVSAPKDMLPQSVGSAITYLRRYGLSIIGLVTDDDDDGNSSTHSKNQDSDNPF